MLTTIKNAVKITDIRNKLLFTFAMLIIIRLGSQLPVPGVNRAFFADWFAQQTGDAFNFFNAFTGGSFLNFSILALNITPYITSSIIMQLLTIAIPKLEELQKEGAEGRKKIASITRYLTVGLALVESAAMTIGFRNQGILQPGYNWIDICAVIFALTAGSAFLMWVGERITEKGIGNGISVVLVINIISSIPRDLTNLYDQFVRNRAMPTGLINGAVILAIILGMMVLVILLNGGVRRIPVQYAKKVQGRRMVGGQTSSIPLKVNTSGVIPIIFASSLLQFPVVISSFFYQGGNSTWDTVINFVSSSHWFRLDVPGERIYTLGMLVYMVLVIFFAYFYTAITFNPREISENLKKQGGFIPGIRPGKPTSEYLTQILNHIVFIGATFLALIGVLPFIFNGLFKASVSFGGTSLIIIVSVILDTIKQIESQMLVRNYKGFLSD
ncbi:MAG: preprotein translocase subunit SecY [Lachnospiraceae bacterium]|jgi:preprotein translocase subunit SecY|nr:preprotein translocase subunit SecY [Lachnospiraceae bacterium]